MDAIRVCWLLLPISLAAVSHPAAAQQGGDASIQAKIESALSAAPPAVAAHATVVDAEDTVLREGSNGWTCYPASTPEDTPICLDDQWIRWFEALRARETPNLQQFGIAFELRGGSAGNNTSPFDPPAEKRVTYGPVLTIVVPDVSVLRGMPTDPYSGGPFVMWQGTPYAHLHIPLTSRQGSPDDR